MARPESAHLIHHLVKKGDQMGDDLAFKVGIIGLGLLSSTLLTIAVFSI
jgi:hypothetical protein